MDDVLRMRLHRPEGDSITIHFGRKGYGDNLLRKMRFLERNNRRVNSFSDLASIGVWGLLVDLDDRKIARVLRRKFSSIEEGLPVFHVRELDPFVREIAAERLKEIGFIPSEELIEKLIKKSLVDIRDSSQKKLPELVTRYRESHWAWEQSQVAA